MRPCFLSHSSEALDQPGNQQAAHLGWCTPRCSPQVPGPGRGRRAQSPGTRWRSWVLQEEGRTLGKTLLSKSPVRWSFRLFLGLSTEHWLDWTGEEVKVENLKGNLPLHSTVHKQPILWCSWLTAGLLFISESQDSPESTG